MYISALIYILEILRDKDFDREDKLDLITIRGLLMCFVSLFSITNSIRLIIYIIVCSSKITLLPLIVSASLLIFTAADIFHYVFGGRDKYEDLEDKWLKDNRMTLLDIKKKYIV